jgi:prepilin-type N-terminal cleavage/methylation domain-containing protein
MRGRIAHNGARGFTLVEILVAVTILTMIFSIVFGTFFYTVENAEERQEQAALYYRAGFILNNISQSVGSAYVPYAGSYADYREEGEDERSIFQGKDDSIEDLKADSLHVFTTNPRFGSRDMPGAVSYVSYSVGLVDDFDLDQAFRDENNPLVLKCSSKPLMLEGDEYVSEWTLNIRSFDLQYFDGSGWLEEWTYEDQGILPRAVKVEIELADVYGVPHRFDSVVAVQVNTLIEGQAAVEKEEKQGEEEKEKEEEREDNKKESESLFDEEPLFESGETDNPFLFQ